MCVIGFKLITHILNYMNSNIIVKKHKSRKSKKYRGYSDRIVGKSKLKYRKTTSVKGKFYGIFSNFS